MTGYMSSLTVARQRGIRTRFPPVSSETGCANQTVEKEQNDRFAMYPVACEEVNRGVKAVIHNHRGHEGAQRAPGRDFS